MSDPLVVTAVPEESAQADLDAQRRRWFPPERLQVGAHVTLFHALPGSCVDELAALLDELTRGVEPPPLRVDEPFALGRGVAFRLRSRRLEEVRERIAARFRGVLTDQDARRFRPHVTIQNKVSPAEAARTLDAVAAGHVPYDTVVESLAVWRYRRGPWEAAGTYRFG